jgi:hypothetical protein
MTDRAERHKRQRRNAPGPTPEQLAERFKIDGDPENALRVLLGVTVVVDPAKDDEQASD